MISPLSPSDSGKLWGISGTDLIKKLKLENYTTFKPEDKPDYSNRIIDFFGSMNSDNKVIITIIRTSGIPEVDYCFFNDKLYSISEDWRSIDKSKAYDILKNTKQKYDEISSEGKNNNIIYSFKKDKTKIMLYEKVIDEKMVQVRIFYYSKDLFSIFLNE